jgi:hypothetical protein
MEIKTVSTLQHSARTVKPTRPLRLVRRYFGEGILDEPSEPTWAPAVRPLMAEMGYTSQAVSTAIEWIGTHGNLDTCPDVEPADALLIDGLVRKALQASLEASADAQVGWDVEGHPSTWPASVDAHVYVPTDSERSWWAQMIDNDINAEASARSVDNLQRGLIAPDVAERIARTSLVGHQS